MPPCRPLWLWDAANYTDGSQNPLIVLDNIEVKQMTEDLTTSMLTSITGITKEKRKSGTDSETITERTLLKMILRVHLEHVSYPHIAQIIALLERYYTPADIGVENGGNGLAVVQELLTLDKYKGLELEGRLKGYDFGGMTRMAVRDGKEIKKRTKELMTSLINGALQRKQVIFPSDDLEVEDQFPPPTHTHCGTARSSIPRATTTSSTRCAAPC